MPFEFSNSFGWKNYFQKNGFLDEWHFGPPCSIYVENLNMLISAQNMNINGILDKYYDRFRPMAAEWFGDIKSLKLWDG